MPAVQAFSQALENVFGKRPVFRREGGSIPVVAEMQDILGIGSVVAGFSTSADNQHGPNEKFYIHNYFRGIDTVIDFFFNLDEQYR
jgi:acetylornithine deacetylase/succinyl-diaminopimelate desuccinylase-like protein